MEPLFDPLRCLAIRIRSEADIAARPGQHDRLHAIADEIIAMVDLAAAEGALCGYLAAVALVVCDRWDDGDTMGDDVARLRRIAEAVAAAPPPPGTPVRSGR